jgi:hypothetical protein
MDMRTLVALAVTVLSAPGHAQFVDGNTLQRWCVSDQVGDQEACLGYVIGVTDVLIARQADDSGPRVACLPSMEANDVVETVRQHLQTHLDGDATASDVVALALANAFPCS